MCEKDRKKDSAAALTEEQDQADRSYMQEALGLAQKAFDQGDTPIGAVITYQGQIIGRGYNCRNALKNPLEHAEITAIRQAAEVIGDWRLEETTMYVTLEPCPMCAGAIVQSRIPRVVIGAMNPKAGCAGSIYNLLEEERFNHRVQVRRYVMEEESRKLLQDFFARLRRLEQEKKEAQRAQESDHE